MIHVAAAIADFMLMLITAAFWAGAGIAGWALAGFGAVAGLLVAGRRWLRRRMERSDDPPR